MNITAAPQQQSLPPTPPPPPAPAAPSQPAPNGDGFDKALGHARKAAKPKDATPASKPAATAKGSTTQTSKTTDPKAKSVEDGDTAGKGQTTDSKSQKGQQKASVQQDQTATDSQDDAEEQADTVVIKGKTVDPKQTDSTPVDSTENTTADAGKTTKTKSTAKATNTDQTDPTTQANIAAGQIAPVAKPAGTQGDPDDGDSRSTPTQAVNGQAVRNAKAQAAADAPDDGISDGDVGDVASSGGDPASPVLNPVTSSNTDIDPSVSAASGSIDGATSHDTAKPQAPAGLQNTQFGSVLQSKTNQTASAANATALTPAAPAEVQFAGANHGNIVSGITGKLLPDGGTMHIRLDPPELGAVQVTVKMEHGALSASFQTSNESATQVLSHSLGQLKQALESQGVSVDRLHVQQSPKQETSSNNSKSEDSESKQNQAQERGSQQDEQRREVLRRMWRRVAGGGDPLDLVA